jgi:hypothetical protein
VLKQKKHDIAYCRASIPESYQRRYVSLGEGRSQRTKARKRLKEEIDESVASIQESALNSMLERRGNVSRTSSIFNFFSPACSGNNSGGMRVTSFTSSHSFQPSIAATMTNQGDIRKSNNASLEMAVADFFHSENIADSVVESPGSNGSSN